MYITSSPRRSPNHVRDLLLLWLLLIFLLLLSCSPERKVQRATLLLQQKGRLAEMCDLYYPNDTSEHVTYDTTILHTDTTLTVLRVDTTLLGDDTVIIRKYIKVPGPIKIITKARTVYDQRRIGHLARRIKSVETDRNKLEGVVQHQDRQLKDMRRERRWGLAIVVLLILLLLRKPILRTIRTLLNPLGKFYPF